MTVLYYMYKSCGKIQNKTDVNVCTRTGTMIVINSIYTVLIAVKTECQIVVNEQ